MATSFQGRDRKKRVKKSDASRRFPLRTSRGQSLKYPSSSSSSSPPLLPPSPLARQIEFDIRLTALGHRKIRRSKNFNRSIEPALLLLYIDQDVHISIYLYIRMCERLLLHVSTFDITIIILLSCIDELESRCSINFRYQQIIYRYTRGFT